MRRAIVAASVIAVLGMGIFAVRLVAQEKAPAGTDKATVYYTCRMHPQVRATFVGACPMCGMSLVNPAQRKKVAARGYCRGCIMHGTAGAAGPRTAKGSQPTTPQPAMTPAMMKRCRMMMQTPVFLDSPGAIRGQAKALGLSEEQKNSLTDIANEARKKALAVLSAEQRKKLGDLPDKPVVMMQMCPMMRQMMGDKGQDRPMMMCPMMQQMKRMMTSDKTQDRSMMMCPMKRMMTSDKGQDRPMMMCPMMRQMMGDRDQDRPMMMCPMMRRMNAKPNE